MSGNGSGDQYLNPGYFDINGNPNYQPAAQYYGTQPINPYVTTQPVAVNPNQYNSQRYQPRNTNLAPPPSCPGPELYAQYRGPPMPMQSSGFAANPQQNFSPYTGSNQPAVGRYNAAAGFANSPLPSNLSQFSTRKPNAAPTTATKKLNGPPRSAPMTYPPSQPHNPNHGLQPPQNKATNQPVPSSVALMQRQQLAAQRTLPPASMSAAQSPWSLKTGRHSKGKGAHIDGPPKPKPPVKARTRCSDCGGTYTTIWTRHLESRTHRLWKNSTLYPSCSF